MTDKIKKLVEDLREDALWASCNEWEVPITLGDNLDAAADLIEALSAELERVKRELDAAVEELRDSAYCVDCVHCEKNSQEEPCKTCIADLYCSKPHWQWKGVNGDDNNGQR